MADIYLGLAILSSIAGAAFWLALRLTRSAPRFRCDLLGLLVVVAMAWFTVNLWNQARLAQLLPYSNLVVVGNWFLVGAGFLGGIAWRRVGGSHWRRGALLGGLLAASVYSAVYPLLGQRPQCSDRWEGNVCIQTTRYTCSPASAATLLRAYGIPATEEEMTDLCLTRRGTSWLGLYRGLKRKTAGTEWDVECVQGTPYDLRRLLDESEGPLILSVGIEPQSRSDPEYLREAGWVPGQRHSVVLFGFLSPQVLTVGDPAIGRELWTWDELQALWQGEGIRLVRRRSAGGRIAAERSANVAQGAERAQSLLVERPHRSAAR